MLKAMLVKMVKDFNDYSELVALNYAQQKENKCAEDFLQWNRGSLNKIEEYLKELASGLGITLNWECKEHTFGFDDWTRQLEYRTVSISLEDIEKLGA